MKLDYTLKGFFTLHAAHGEIDPWEVVGTHGLDYSVTASSSRGEHVLFTSEAYVAIPFFEYATPAAVAQLGDIHSRVAQSWADGTEAFPVPTDLELWAFQRGSVRYVLDCFNRGHGALVGDEPGLGKTEVALVTANAIGATRTLIVCPASIRQQWAARARLWSTIPRPICSVITSSRLGFPPSTTHNFTIISYDLIRNKAIRARLLAEEYDLLILDEAHYAKSGDSGRSLAIFGPEGIATRAKHTLALSGTPDPNRPAELFTLTKALCWDAIDWMTQHAFEQRFNQKQLDLTADGRPYVRQVVGRLPELRSRLRGNFMVRHLKRDVMTQLKLPVYDLVRVEETASVKAALKAEGMLGIDPETLKGADSVQFDGAISTVRKEMGIAMAPQVADYAAMCLDGGEEKLVLFGWHIEVLDIYEAKLAKYGVVRVDGRTSSAQKTARIQQFINDPNTRGIIGNALSLGTGTDGLQHAASHCLIGEPDWVPGNNQQMADRLDRGGQKGTVQVDIFVAPGSLTEKVLSVALRKLANITASLDGGK
jgi:SWI/SNF-related matrix-associated actin-dependent regulator 1 of chromatin subfamily A